MAGRSLPAVSRRVEQYARHTATPVTLRELYRWGCGGAAERTHMREYLHTEVAVRNAQLCKELQLLPFGLAQARSTARVMSLYSQYVDWLDEFPKPVDEDGERRFLELLRRILDDSVLVIPRLGEAVREVREQMSEERYEEFRSEISLIMDRFCIKRIGLRFLLEHFIESSEAKPGASGIIHSNVSVGPILRTAGDTARKACAARYGAAPEVQVVGDGQWSSVLRSAADLSHNRQFTYVPSHLSFMCVELLKNACEAVVRHHRDKAASRLPPVQAIFAHGDEEVCVKISDQGGGIARSDMLLAWSYFDVVGKAGVQDAAKGTGLPLARLHARYYGGDLVLKSMEGFGTDAYLFMNRLGENCEKLPPGVRLSPAQSDSSLGKGESISLDSLGTMSEQETAFLERCLEQHRRRRQWRVMDSVSGAT